MYFPKLVKLRAKIDGHIIEQKRPPLRKAYTAISPVVNKPTSMAISPSKPKIFNVESGLSFPRKNPRI